MALFKFSKDKGVIHDIGLLQQNLISEDTASQVLEAYKTIRTNLQYALHPINGKVMLFSSAMPGEGKSTTASNLAVTFAQNSKVLLIDADMRKPVMHKIFQVDNTHGLSQFLGGFEPLSKALRRDVRPGLDLITAGVLPPNPSELLGSKNMTLFLNKVQEYYDYIIIDTPPVNVVTDAVVLSKKVNGVVLVSRQNITTSKALRQTVDTMKNVRARILGVVLTGVKEKYKMFSRYSDSQRGSYSKKYSYRYYAYYRDSNSSSKGQHQKREMYDDVFGISGKSDKDGGQEKSQHSANKQN